MAARSSPSIVYRLTALAVAVSTSAFIINGLLVSEAFDPLFEDLSDSVAGEIAATHLALSAATPAERAVVMQKIGRLGLVARPADKDRFGTVRLVGTDDFNPVLDRINKRLGPGFEARPKAAIGNVAPQPLEVKFSVDGEPWVLELPSPHGAGRKQFSSLLYALLLVALIPLGALVAGIRLITRPMARLALEVADRSHRLRPLDMQHATSTEFEKIFLAFNGLVSAVVDANDAQRSMLAGVSHDLRTPLARLRLRAEMECAPKTSRALEADCQALDRIIGQFVAYAKGEVSASLGVSEPITELLLHVRKQYLRHDIGLSIEDPRVAQLAYPDLAIWRVATNLIDNAITYGKAPITLRLEVTDAECRLWVTDAGTGIAEGELQNAVKPFVKLRATSRPGLDNDVGHCGLGLAIVAQICREMGGRILLRPFDGKTSAVGVSLGLDHAVVTATTPMTAAPL